jgi:hypothetical protein
MALDPNIALGVRGVEVANPLAQYAQVAQIQSMQNQNQVSQMQLDQMRRDEATLQQIQAKAVEHGGPADLNQIADAYLKSGSPKFVEFGIGLRQKLDERAQFAKIMSMGETPTAMPSAPASAAPATNALTPTMQPGALGSGTFGMAPEPVNRLASAPIATAPVANALAAPQMAAPAMATPAGPDVSMLRNKRNAFLAMGTPQSIAAARAIDADIALASRQQPETIREMQAFGLPITPEGFAKYTALKQSAPQPVELTRAIADRDRLIALGRPVNDPDVAAYTKLINKLSTHAPATTVNVSTEKAYGGAFGGKLADTDINKLTTAEKAPQLAESANRIIGLVNQGNVFTGPAAEVKMNIARVLNVAGASNDEKIANTEALIAATGQSTLDAIKGAGLGTGQGFTNKDLTFLQGIAGGTIGLTAKTLTDLATLQHRVAVRSADAWNKRAGEIPKEVVQGTGLSTVPIKVPELSAVGPIAIFAVNPQTGARIQSTDGGNTWKPAGAK